MPSTFTYPGVYVEEVPSGVRTISGVATSITAFVGFTAKGPVNRATRVFNFGEFTRDLGDLHRDSPVAYAVQQFFLNGGADAYVVRVAAGSAAAAVQVRWGPNAADVALTVRAASEGAWGNGLRLAVDHATSSPDSTFNLTVSLVQPAGEPPVAPESFRNLSMNSRSPNYVVGVVNAGSRLVRVDRPALGLSDANDRGYSLGSVDLPGLDLSGAPRRLAGTLNGAEAFELEFQPGGVGANAIVTAVNAAIAAGPLAGRMEAVRARPNGVFTGPDGPRTRLMLRSLNVAADPATRAEHSSVTITPASASDASVALGMGAASAGREREGAAVRRPAPVGTTGSDLSGTAGNVGGNLTVAIDEHLPAPAGVTSLLAATAITVPDTAVGPALAAALQAEIHALANPAAQQNLIAQDVEVGFVAGSLWVRLAGDDHPHAVISFGGADVGDLGLPGAAGPRVNVQRYAPGQGVAVGAQAGVVAGSDGRPPGAAELLGSENAKTGIYALLDVDLFNLLCIPGTAALPAGEQKAVIQAAVALCERERAFYVVDPPQDATLQSVGPWAADVTRSRNAAVYFPRIRAADPLDGFRLREMPASGAVAGVFARTDAQRGVWKAPAGTDAVLNGTQALSVPLTDMETGTLNVVGVNALRAFPTYGRVVWGARTRAGADENTDEYKYVPIRRLALNIEETLYRNTQWVVFEPNDEPLWAQIRLNVGAFMNGLFRQGAFQGRSPREAYLVKCDAETTTQYDVDRGIVNILVAFAPLKPAEFVVIRIQQKAQVPA